LLHAVDDRRSQRIFVDVSVVERDLYSDGLVEPERSFFPIAFCLSLAARFAVVKPVAVFVLDSVNERGAELLELPVCHLVGVDSFNSVAVPVGRFVLVALGLTLATRFAIIYADAFVVRDSVGERCAELFFLAVQQRVRVLYRNRYGEPVERAFRIALSLKLPARVYFFAPIRLVVCNAVCAAQR